MNSQIASITISPIQTSRESISASSPSDLRLSMNQNKAHTHSNNCICTKTPLQQEVSDITSPPQQGLRKDQFTRFRNGGNSFEEDRNDDNDENVNDINHFNPSYSFMRTTNSTSEQQVGRTRVGLGDNLRIFVDEIDAPSDERDDDATIYEMIDPHTQHQPSNESVDNEIHRNGDDEIDDETEEEQRRLREEEESEALAIQLMSEEAMASYAQSSDFLRAHASEYSEEDLHALEALMAEEDPMIEEVEEEGDSTELSYETLLRLGERIGDVKAERWALKAKQEIEKLKIIKFHCEMAEGKDENDCCVKCLVCQFQYEEGETIQVLPCKHRFHKECVDQWLLAKDHCPYCRQSIIE